MSESISGQRHFKTTEELTEFLQLELKMARTMLDLAHTEDRQPADPRGMQQALKNAQKALTAIFYFLPRLGQCAAAEEIGRTAQEFQAELDSFAHAHESS